MKGWQISDWICLLVGALNPSTFVLISRGSGRRCWPVTSCILHVVLGWNSPSGYSGFSKLSKSLEGYWLASLFLFPWKLGFCYGGHSQSHVGKETKKIGCIIIIVTLWFGRCSILSLFLS